MWLVFLYGQIVFFLGLIDTPNYYLLFVILMSTLVWSAIIGLKHATIPPIEYNRMYTQRISRKELDEQ